MEDAKVWSVFSIGPCLVMLPARRWTPVDTRVMTRDVTGATRSTDVRFVAPHYF